jgi:hypothetical protein
VSRLCGLPLISSVIVFSDLTTLRGRAVWISWRPCGITPVSMIRARLIRGAGLIRLINIRILHELFLGIA